MEIYFTEQFLTYLSDSFGTMASKIVLLADDSEVEINGDIATLPVELSLVKKGKANINTTKNNFEYEYTGKIKEADKRWKRKSPVLAGALTELTWGTSTGTITDLSLWGLESATELLEGSATNIFPNMTSPSIFGDTMMPTWGTSQDFGYSTEPALYYSSDQALFVRESPTNRLTTEIFERVFNSCTDYSVHILKSWSADVVNEDYGTFPFSFISSSTDLFGQTSSNLYPIYNGSYMDGTSVVPINTMAGLLSYPGVTTEFKYDESNELISFGSASSLTSFFFSTDAGLMYATFSDIQVTVTSTDPIAGFFVTNEMIKNNNTSEEEIPLILYAVKFDNISFTHTPGNYSILKTPKVSLSMDVIII